MEHFCNKRNKKYFTDSYFFLANFKHETIGDVMNNIDSGNKSDIPFTLGNYCDFYKVARPRIFFRTKPKTSFQRLVDNVSNNKTDSEDDFDIQPIGSSQRGSSSSTVSFSSSSPATTTSFSPSATISSFSSTPSRNFSLSSATEPTERPIPVIGITQESMELGVEDSNHSLPQARRILIDEQDRAFAESLNQDRQKEMMKQQEEAELQRFEIES